MKAYFAKEVGNGLRSTVRVFFVMMMSWFLSLTVHATCFATTVALQWDAVTDSGLDGYRIYYQADSSAQPFTGTGAAQGVSPVPINKDLINATISGLDPAHAYYFAVTSYDATGAESSFSNVVYVPEMIPPTTLITFPANGAAVGGTVSITASGSDNIGVTKVEFYVNGALMATDTATPYVYSWNTSLLAAGVYTLMAKAYDAAGNVGQSSNVAVMVVNDTTPPSVMVTSPSNSAILSSTVAVTASANDNVGVSSVEFYENGTLLSATNVAPYSYNWNTTALANGSYTLIARAYDVSGNMSQSDNIVVTVNNTGHDATAPTVSVVAPLNNASVSGVVPVTASAFDNVGVTRVRFYVNGSLKSTVTAAPFIFNWNTTALANGNYTLYVRASDAANNTKQSSPIAVKVFKDTVAPSVFVTAPANNATVSGIVAIALDAADNAAVTKVELYVNNVLQGTASTAPYGYNWNTTTLANGTYTLAATVYDGSGNVGQSANVNVTVTNTIYNQSTGMYYSSLQQAYDNALTGATLLALGIQLNENLVCFQTKSIKIIGGYNQGFTSNNGYTTLRGSYRLGRGAVVLNRLVVN